MADLESSILIKILDSFTAPLRKLRDGLGEVEEAGDKAKKKLSVAADLNQAAEAAGRFGQMLIGPVRGATEEFAEFDHALSKLSAMGGGERGSSVFNAMKDQALALGAATQYSATEVAELQTNFLKANFSTAQTMAVVQQTMAAATAEGIGLADAATIVSGALNGMRYSVAETARVTDVLALASVKSDADMRGLSEALSYVGPKAADTKTSFELVSAMLGKLSDAQIKGSQAGTTLRGVFDRLINPTKMAAASFEKMGISATALRQIQSSVASGHIDDALRRIGTASEKLPDRKRLELLSEIFGAEAGAGASVLITSAMNLDMGEGSKGLSALVEQLHKAQGQAQQMADTMQDDLAGSLERAGGAVQGLQMAIGEAFSPTVKTAAGNVEELAGDLSSWVKLHPRVTESTMALIAMFGVISLGAKGVLLAAAAHETLGAAILKGRVAMQWTSAQHLAFAGAALAAGYAIGTYINKVFELDDKLSALFGRARGVEVTDKQGLDGANPVQTLAGGWQVNKVTGEILKEGTGPMPKSVRKKRERGAAAGATTTAEVNAVMRGDRAANDAAFRARGGMLAGVDAAAQLAPGGIPGTGAQVEATREQTAQLLETLHKQEKAAEETAKATAALNRRLGATAGGVPLVYM